MVCDYEDVFQDELSGYLRTRMWTLSLSYALVRHPFLCLLIGWHGLSCRNPRSNCKNCWTRVLLDRTLHLGALWFYLLGKRSKFKWNDLCPGIEKEAYYNSYYDFHGTWIEVHGAW